jgi:uncharacterized protein (DUF1501 family)
MKRREFIRNTALGAVGTFFIPEFLRGMDLVGLEGQPNFRKLIVIQLSGGNDGLNTIIPFENDIYYNLRPKIGIKKEDVLKINDQLGFNPKFEAFNKLYKEGLVSIVNSVGYPNPNRSHFRSMDIWHTAVDSNKYSKTGWLGRYMDAHCTNSHSMLELDAQLSLSLHGQKRNGLALEKSDKLYKTLRDKYFKDVIKTAESADLNEDNQGYLYKTLIQTNQSAKYLAETHTVKDNNIEFPKSKLGKKLAQVSQFIQSGFSTQVYYVSHNGFDSHVKQRWSQDALLSDYSESVGALVKSLEKSGELESTLILTFSEFGRRVKENGSQGTDHGKANNLFLIGKNLNKPGIYNNAPDLDNLDNGDISYKVDFRNIYSDIINEWFHQDANTIISKNFNSLGII